VLNSNDASLTQSGVILGTPYYMAPEQARGQAIDHRADIYSLGVMMYHAFTGRLPFVADSAVAVLTAHAIDEPTKPSAISMVDPGVEELILRCMEKSPANRYGSMREIAEVLRGLRRAGGSFALPPAPSGAFPRIDTQSGASLSGPHPSLSGPFSGPYPAQAAPQGGSGAKVFVAAAVLMLALGGLGAVVFFLRRGPAVPVPATTSAASAPLAPSAPVETATARGDASSAPSAETPSASSAAPGTSAAATGSSSPPVQGPVAQGNPGAKPPRGGALPTSKPGVPTAAPTSAPSSPSVSGDVRSPFK
jgi:serine/threonine-protein kinase